MIVMKGMKTGGTSDSSVLLSRGLARMPAGGLNHIPKVSELLVPPLDQVLDLEPLQLAHRLGDVLLEVVCGGMRVAVCPAEGFLNDPINHAQRPQVPARQLQAFG